MKVLTFSWFFWHENDESSIRTRQVIYSMNKRGYRVAIEIYVACD
jgi:hypothetical protein